MFVSCKSAKRRIKWQEIKITIRRVVLSVFHDFVYSVIGPIHKGSAARLVTMLLFPQTLVLFTVQCCGNTNINHSHSRCFCDGYERRIPGSDL